MCTLEQAKIIEEVALDFMRHSKSFTSVDIGNAVKKKKWMSNRVVGDYLRNNLIKYAEDCGLGYKKSLINVKKPNGSWDVALLYYPDFIDDPEAYYTDINQKADPPANTDDVKDKQPVVTAEDLGHGVVYGAKSIYISPKPIPNDPRPGSDSRKLSVPVASGAVETLPKRSILTEVNNRAAEKELWNKVKDLLSYKKKGMETIDAALADLIGKLAQIED